MRKKIGDNKNSRLNESKSTYMSKLSNRKISLHTNTSNNILANNEAIIKN